ncbi:hypothetical protein [Nocardia acidivorans]|uniref:hypothetical protein n=1 Tax=Nocardia acidivorans TaxID=404580 RepID=UPI0012FBC714|nr:hypothetical protein [Nocardia acidivorans]
MRPRLPGRARALAMLAEIATAAEDSEKVAEMLSRLRELELSDADRAVVAEELGTVEVA